MLRTERLLLRPWRDEDAVPCAAMTAKPSVMHFFGGTREGADADAWLARTRAHHEREGFGIWAVELPGVAPFIGFVGLARVPEWRSFAGQIEAVWTLDDPYWRKGYATEAARAAIADGFARLGLERVIATTAEINLPSRGVMEALGMTRDPADDFDHPRIAEGSMLRRHVLYILPKP